VPICDILSKSPAEGVFPCYNNLVFPSIFAVLNILYHAESERAGVCLKQSLHTFCWHEVTAYVMLGKLLPGEDKHSCN
jgi:hypothetical protein